VPGPASGDHHLAASHGGRSGRDDELVSSSGRDDEANGRLLDVGWVVKPHGLRGDLVVTLVTNREERVAPGSVLIAEDGRELIVRRSSRQRNRFVVHFDGVSHLDEAEALRGCRLLAGPLDEPEALWVHELVGARVEDTSGNVLGAVESVQANPASDLLVLDTGPLIPLRFVVEHEPGQRVTVEVPDGLLDLS
jgi:16S rRNA processing protein RimM